MGHQVLLVTEDSLVRWAMLGFLGVEAIQALLVDQVGFDFGYLLNSKEHTAFNLFMHGDISSDNFQSFT